MPACLQPPVSLCVVDMTKADMHMVQAKACLRDIQHTLAVKGKLCNAATVGAMSLTPMHPPETLASTVLGCLQAASNGSKQ